MFGAKRKASGKVIQSKDTHRGRDVAETMSKKTAQAVCAEIVLLGNGAVQGVVFTGTRYETNGAGQAVFCGASSIGDEEVLDTIMMGGIASWIAQRKVPITLRLELSRMILAGEDPLK